LSRGDLRLAIDLLGAVLDSGSPEPFPMVVLDRLRDVAGADVAAGYVESSADRACESYALVTRPPPDWLFDELDNVGRQDPTHAFYCRDATESVAISDVLSAREFERREVYRRVCEPLGTGDSLRIYLPAPPGRARFFFFDRSRRGFSPRSRELLELLRPHLAAARSRYDAPGPATTAGLTAREATIIRLVAVGDTNAVIATKLWISEHTVRKHLENVYAKLGVHSRTAALAALGHR
jgi:DNA-binding CsgD family transcriptional regulator